MNNGIEGSTPPVESGLPVVESDVSASEQKTTDKLTGLDVSNIAESVIKPEEITTGRLAQQALETVADRGIQKAVEQNGINNPPNLQASEIPTHRPLTADLPTLPIAPQLNDADAYMTTTSRLLNTNPHGETPIPPPPPGGDVAFIRPNFVQDIQAQQTTPPEQAGTAANPEDVYSQQRAETVAPLIQAAEQQKQKLELSNIHSEINDLLVKRIPAEYQEKKDAERPEDRQLIGQQGDFLALARQQAVDEWMQNPNNMNRAIPLANAGNQELRDGLTRRYAIQAKDSPTESLQRVAQNGNNEYLRNAAQEELNNRMNPPEAQSDTNEKANTSESEQTPEQVIQAAQPDLIQRLARAGGINTTLPIEQQMADIAKMTKEEQRAALAKAWNEINNEINNKNTSAEQKKKLNLLLTLLGLFGTILFGVGGEIQKAGTNLKNMAG